MFQYPWLNCDPTQMHLSPIPNWCGISLLALKMLVVLLGSLQDLSNMFDIEIIILTGQANPELILH